MKRAHKGKFAARCLAFLLSAGLAASAWPGDRPLFWSISEDGEPRGYLLGTIHSEAPEVLDFSPAFLETLAGSRVFAMELVPDLPTLARLAERMLLPADTSLEDLAGPERFARVSEALQAYGVPAAQARRMQPWAAMMTLSVPPPRTGLFMDFSLSLRASGSGAEVVGLETLDQQLAFLDGMDLQQQLQLLDHAVEESGRVQEMHDQMIESYLANDLDELHRHAMKQLQDLDAGAREAFISEGIVARNRRMLDSALRHLPQGGLFMAVGALHLSGESGLLALLREAGYTLQPAGWPFNDPP